MAFEIHRNSFPGLAASNIAPFAPVKLAPGALDRGLIPAATVTDEILGVTHATALRGEAVSVHEENDYAKVQAAASLGVGANVAVASSNFGFGPVAAASGVARFRAGVAVSPAAAGEFFTIKVSPRQLGGLA